MKVECSVCWDEAVQFYIKYLVNKTLHISLLFFLLGFNFLKVSNGVNKKKRKEKKKKNGNVYTVINSFSLI